jgi:hypothetical protein
VLSFAWTGTASILLIDGRTAHSSFQLPISLHEDARCGMNPNSAKAQLLKEVSLICGDEVKHYFFKVCNSLIIKCFFIIKGSDDSIECLKSH